MCTTKTGECNFGSISQGLSGKQLMPWCFITGVLEDPKTGVSEAIQGLTTAGSGYCPQSWETEGKSLGYQNGKVDCGVGVQTFEEETTQVLLVL